MSSMKGSQNFLLDTNCREVTSWCLFRHKIDHWTQAPGHVPTAGKVATLPLLCWFNIFGTPPFSGYVLPLCSFSSAVVLDCGAVVALSWNSTPHHNLFFVCKFYLKTYLLICVSSDCANIFLNCSVFNCISYDGLKKFIWCIKYCQVRMVSNKSFY